MSRHHRTLHPFEASADGEVFSLEAWISRFPGRLEIRYRLVGPVDQLILPPPAGQPRRRDQLWQSTCFEAFIAHAGQPAYREVNLSPSGDWNVYRLTGYRACLEAETGCRSVLSEVERQPGSLRVDLTLDLAPWFGEGQALDMAVTAVLQHQGGQFSYWALAHTGPEADFHDRRGFLLQLQAPQE
ncbi:MAG: DOMON-like domain-containing protein [Cyanobacteria bacterium]|nr:DOMON-like domain-containing protein [Cyanobacteria bacterium bin.51]